MILRTSYFMYTHDSTKSKNWDLILAHQYLTFWCDKFEYIISKILKCEILYITNLWEKKLKGFTRLNKAGFYLGKKYIIEKIIISSLHGE